MAIVLDHVSQHLSTKRDLRVGKWAAANNIEFAYVPTNASWLERIAAQLQALRYLAPTARTTAHTKSSTR
jgi:hypothetical protein